MGAGTPLRTSYEVLTDLRMPLFTILSGFVYAFRPLPDLSRYGSLVTGKARRLLVPLVVVGTAFMLTQYLVPGTNSSLGPADWLHELLFGPGYLWFLQSIFLIFLLVGLLDGLGALRKPSNWGLALLGSAITFVFVQVPAEYAVFSINGAIRLLPFFLLGYGAHRFPEILNLRTVPVLVVVTAAGLVLRTMVVLGTAPVPPSYLNRFLALTLGAAACTLAVVARQRISVPWLARLGPYSYGIYLLHVFGTAGARIVLARLGITSTAVLFLVSLLAGLAFPVLFELTAGRNRWVKMLVLGQRPPNRPTGRALDPGVEPSPTGS